MKTTPRDIIELLFKHRLAVIVFSVVVVVFTLGYVKWAKKIYTSQAQILIRLGQEQMGSLQFMNSGKNVYVTRREQELKNEQTIFESQRVLDSAVKEIMDKGLAESIVDGDVGQDGGKPAAGHRCPDAQVYPG